MHHEGVERRKWIGENQFLRALNFCMLLPGPEAQQLATYIGWRLHGTWGGIAAGPRFVFPSIFVMLLLSYLAKAHVDIPAVAAAFYGIQPVVVAVVVEAVLRICKKALKDKVLQGFAVLAFVAISSSRCHFPTLSQQPPSAVCSCSDRCRKFSARASSIRKPASAGSIRTDRNSCLSFLSLM